MVTDGFRLCNRHTAVDGAAVGEVHGEACAVAVIDDDTGSKAAVFKLDLATPAILVGCAVVAYGDGVCEILVAKGLRSVGDGEACGIVVKLR